MCELCFKENEKASDALKMHDDDLREMLSVGGFDAMDFLMKSYDRLTEVPDDEMARINFIIISTLAYQTHPIGMYQSMRDHRATQLAALKILVP